MLVQKLVTYEVVMNRFFEVIKNKSGGSKFK